MDHSMVTPDQKIMRHKTAIRRRELSLPVKLAIQDGVIVPKETTVFDYGCGRGQDMQLLAAVDVPCRGWDPAYFPEHEREGADVVNLGYVLNVIESPAERDETLRAAWALCRKALVVSAQVLIAGRGATQVEFGDGILTSRNTFQRYYRQDELKAYLEQVLCTEALPAAPGVFYVFREEAAAQALITRRYRRRTVLPSADLRITRFEASRELLEPFMEVVARLGRVPEPDECPGLEGILERFGSLPRAFAVVTRATGEAKWNDLFRRATEDLLVSLALGRFRGRPPFAALPVGLQRDIRAFYGNYKRGCTLADELLFRAGDAKAVDEACKSSAVGKLLPEALYVHASALESLTPLLRVYEGCGRAYLGEVEGANLVKIHRHSGKISYLVYEDFERDPHPALVRSVKLSLRSRELECFEYLASANPPVLHRKETFLDRSHPLYEKFARLSQQEEQHGLLESSSTIGMRAGWEMRLLSRGFALRGHRLVRVKERDRSTEGGDA